MTTVENRDQRMESPLSPVPALGTLQIYQQIPGHEKEIPYTSLQTLVGLICSFPQGSVTLLSAHALDDGGNDLLLKM